MGNPVDDDPELAAAIGRLISKWAHTEFKLAMIFGAFTNMNSPMDVVVFSFFKNTQTQKNVLLKTGKTCGWLPEKMYDQLDDILKAYTDLAGVRNEYAHNPLGWESDTEERTAYLMLRSSNPNPDQIPYYKRSVGAEEINAATTAIISLNSAIATYLTGVLFLRAAHMRMKTAAAVES